jgi:Fe-S cluster biogenesis protein NfuA
MSGPRLTDAQARERAARVESLLERLDGLDETARSLATDVLQAVVDLHGEALARLVGHVPAETLAADEVVAHVLLLHGLHPVDLASRVSGALQALRPMLATHAAEASLTSLDDGVARVRLRTGGQAGMAGTASLRRAVQEALQRAAPDLAGLEIEPVGPPPVLIPAESVRLRAPALDGAGAPGTRPR